MQELNSEQKEFVDYTKMCVSRRGREMLLVNSPGGTGKTHCIKILSRELYKYCEISILAPTHKAVSLFLESKIFAQTIHRFLEAKSDYDEEGELVFLFGDRKKINKREYHLLIVDECSMVDSTMFAAFEKYFATSNSTIVFMGDHSQIPPVGESYSVVFGKNLRQFMFVQNMRTNYETIRDLCQFFREDYTQKALFEKVNMIPLTVALNMFCESVDSDNVYLTWTNEKRQQVSNMIRNLKYGKTLSQDMLLDRFVCGERLIFSGYRNTKDESWYLQNDERPDSCKYLDEEALGVLSVLRRSKCLNNIEKLYYSNDYIEIKQISKIKMRVSFLSEELSMFRIIDQHNTIWCYPCNESVKILDEYFKMKSKEIKKMKDASSAHCLIEVDWEKVTNESRKKPRLQPESGESLREKIGKLDMFRASAQCKVGSSSNTSEGNIYSEFIPIACESRKTENVRVNGARNKVHIKEKWINYHYIKKLIYPDLEYSYSMTVHKAQGSQWNNVYIDLPLINKSRDSKKLLYTAVSRAMKQIVFTN